MLKKASVLLQYCLPQHLLSCVAGYFAESTQPWLKNKLIRWFIKNYKIDMSEAVIEDASLYPSFNSFFIRQMKPVLRPISSGQNDIISPVDGTAAQVGRIHQHQLIQAKNTYFDLAHLLGGDTSHLVDFRDGFFSTLYLAPYNYHRVHMPIDGVLLKTIYVPGRLFSVNQLTSQYIPKLYARNERLITLFQTEAGLMAVILVGAMIVGSIQTVWMKSPIRQKTILTEVSSSPFSLKKGDELGFFKLGSTVILLFENNKIKWSAGIQAGVSLKLGECLGRISDKH